jgi:hypothetical protein
MEGVMGCWHGYHGCGSWGDGPYARRWHEPVDWYAGDAPGYWRWGRPRRADREGLTEELEARLDELQEELRMVSAELTRLRGADKASPERT